MTVDVVDCYQRYFVGIRQGFCKIDTYQKRTPAAWEVEHAQEKKARADAGERMVNSARSVMNTTLSYDPNAPQTMDVEMQVIRIGDVFAEILPIDAQAQILRIRHPVVLQIILALRSRSGMICWM